VHGFWALATRAEEGGIDIASKLGDQPAGSADGWDISYEDLDWSDGDPGDDE